jgi:hypothetical protein
LLPSTARAGSLGQPRSFHSDLFDLSFRQRIRGSQLIPTGRLPAPDETHPVDHRARIHRAGPPERVARGIAGLASVGVADLVRIHHGHAVYNQPTPSVR